MILDRGCFERGCACYDERVDKDGIEVTKKEWVGLTWEEMTNLIADVRGKENKSYEEKVNPTLEILKNAEAKLKEKNT